MNAYVRVCTSVFACAYVCSFVRVCERERKASVTNKKKSLEEHLPSCREFIVLLQVVECLCYSYTLSGIDFILTPGRLIILTPTHGRIGR